VTRSSRTAASSMPSNHSEATTNKSTSALLSYALFVASQVPSEHCTGTSEVVKKGKATERVEVVIVCLLVIVMDVGGGVPAIKADKAQNQASVECRQLIYRAYELGVAAAAVLAASHAIANVAGGCACSRDKLRRPSPNWHMAMWGRRALWWGLQWRRNSEEEGEAAQYHEEEGVAWLSQEMKMGGARGNK
jgi:hypothetical protein